MVILDCVDFIVFFVFFKQKTAYDVPISDWSSDMCSSDLNETDSFVRLKPRSEWRGDKDLSVEDMRKAMAGLPGIEPSFTQPIEMRVSEMLTGARGDLAVKIFGPDLATLGDLAGKVPEVRAKDRKSVV